jgi:hypothetical protein
MHLKIYIACLVLSTLFSCADDSKPAEHTPNLNAIEESESLEKEELHFKDWTEEDGIWLASPLDTAQLIADMNLVDKVDRTDLIKNDPEKSLLSEKIDTFIMYRVTYGCICPDWNVINCDNTSDNSYSGPCQYYMEPAHKDLEINIPYDQLNSNVRFIGKKYLKDAEDRDHGEGSHGGQEFKYYSFEFIRPYIVYGPMYNDTVIRENGVDTVLETLTSYLTVN